VLEGENRERALEVFRHMGDDTPEMLLAAIEKEFVLVRPKVLVNHAGHRECAADCPLARYQTDGCSVGSGVMLSGEQYLHPGPDCPAHRKEKSDA